MPSKLYERGSNVLRAIIVDGRKWWPEQQIDFHFGHYLSYK